ncbi:hypothetical protein [Pseudomonas sp. NBRC 100443]|uniref:hypothetical protein n=1 Tax=Pseudomonas sp. NBRC 100443 TaxID=1113665 RepID=UPI0025563C5F|nr:hypothetical protein [Pseudomonas sp. NBRC 100443]
MKNPSSAEGPVADAVALAGGAIAVAKACGKSRQAVDKWVRSNQLPRTEYTGETDYADRIARLAAERGILLDAAALRASASPKRSAA